MVTHSIKLFTAHSGEKLAPSLFDGLFYHYGLTTCNQISQLLLNFLAITYGEGGGAWLNVYPELYAHPPSMS
jgi:hypothetical protein